VKELQGRVIHKTEGRSVLVLTVPGPTFIGVGSVNWICGHCSYLLAQTMMPGQLDNLVIKCFSCGAFNDIRRRYERSWLRAIRFKLTQRQNP